MEERTELAESLELIFWKANICIYIYICIHSTGSQSPEWPQYRPHATFVKRLSSCSQLAVPGIHHSRGTSSSGILVEILLQSATIPQRPTLLESTCAPACLARSCEQSERGCMHVHCTTAQCPTGEICFVSVGGECNSVHSQLVSLEMTSVFWEVSANGPRLHTVSRQEERC